MHIDLSKYFPENTGILKIISVDEVGRGCLAGPVLAASVLSDRIIEISKKYRLLIKDSKKLSFKQRQEAYKVIKEIFPKHTIAEIDNDIIDKINILNASLLAMKKSIEKQKVEPHIVLVDGNQKIKNLKYLQKTFIKGDNLIITISAASIIAKVERDKIMERYSDFYPEYGFESHMGYGTKKHFAAIKKYGLAPIHRKSFLRNL